MVSVVDDSNTVIEHRSYDPFGKPRQGNLVSTSPATLSDLIGGTPITQRGFTDHEHLDDAQLIHMNGRVYDYNLGRFLSVDPFIQAPGNSQSLNPYSYIMNNPLAGTDPSGYIADCFLAITCHSGNPDNPFDYPETCPFCVSTGEASGNNGAEYTQKKSKAMSTDDEDVGSMSSIGKGTADKASEANDENWRQNYDISEPPNNIKLGGGRAYSDLSDDEKYALHITSEKLAELIRQASESSDPQAKSLDPMLPNAVWYSSIEDEGVWQQASSSNAPARTRYTQGENIQFYGERMVRLLDGLEIKQTFERRLAGYVVKGRFTRDGAFTYVVGHELGHLTRENAQIGSRRPAGAEYNADLFYERNFRNK